MTAIQIVASAGLLLGLGLSMAVWYLAVPATPSLGAALRRLSEPSLRRAESQPVKPIDRAGTRLVDALPTGWYRVPAADLAVLRKPQSQFYGEKFVLALMGLAAPPILGLILLLVGIDAPIMITPFVSLLLAAALWFVPDTSIRRDALAARVEFNHCLTSFIDLVALERRAGSGARKAMHNAARVGAGNWVFDQIADGMAQAELSKLAPWDVINELAAKLHVKHLDDLADTMRLAEQQSMAVYEPLRERNASLRNAQMSDEKALANAVNQTLALPAAMIGVLLVAVLLTPSLIVLILS